MCNALQESFAGASQTTRPLREGNGAGCLDHGNDLAHGDDPEDLPSVTARLLVTTCQLSTRGLSLDAQVTILKVKLPSNWTYSGFHYNNSSRCLVISTAHFCSAKHGCLMT